MKKRKGRFGENNARGVYIEYFLFTIIPTRPTFNKEFKELAYLLFAVSLILCRLIASFEKKHNRLKLSVIIFVHAI